ncbi:MAG TPA: hypothetical protein VGF08_07875 [Terriglobales bacterium]|jgi:hypothetical protein
MSDKKKSEQIVERVVSRVLESLVPQLREELVRQVTAETGTVPGSGSEALLKGLAAIHSATNQRDILRSLLDSAVHHCGRIALFVVKAGHVGGWQGRAFANNDSLKDFALDTNGSLLARVLDSHTAICASASEMDHNFIERFGAPADDQCMLLPLLLKEKVAALIYADAGTESGGRMDQAAVELLVQCAGTWLELCSQRKALPSGTEAAGVSERSDAPIARAAAAHAAPSFSDPFAGHSPRHAQIDVSAVSHAESVTPGDGASGPGDDLAGLPADEADAHKKARRFARLLVDEIKLYNQAKMMEGRKNRDLYDRLKEDIDKSRSTYQKRFGNTPAASGDYFNQEIVRSLAEDDASLLGANFKH